MSEKRKHKKAKSNAATKSDATSKQNAADPVFVEEQAHLSATYEKLQEMREQLAKKVAETDEEAAATKLQMMEDISPDFSSLDETLETYAEYATVNRVIESYEISQEVNSRKLADVELLLKQPYFAKVVLQYKESEPPKTLYIGAAGVSDENCRRMIVDWRSPVAEVYYNQQTGYTQYKVNGRVISVDLQLRRQFDIEEDKLLAYFDTTVAIEDPLLLASLSRTRTSKMKAITTTIQREQNVVVRHEDVPALLVEGVAGSGKTSVLLQRIAYLFYQQREKLDPSEVVLITPNPVFRRYIDNVLPDMGESNPHSFTWDEFEREVIPAGRSRGKMNVPVEVFEQIDAGVPKLELGTRDFREISEDGKVFITTSVVDQMMRKYSNVPMGPRRITLVREELLKRVGTRMKRLAATDSAADDLAALSIEEQLRLFHETVDPSDEQEERALALIMMKDRYAGVYEAIENDEWLRLDRIGMRMLGLEGLDALVWLYLKMALTGFGEPDTKYVMIDEVQDYTEAQLIVLAKYFRRAKFLLLGDSMQAIEFDTATFDQIRQLFQRACGQVSECKLMTSYRSTPAIIELFAKCMPADSGMLVESVQRDDVPPKIHECATNEEYEAKLVEVVKAADKNDGLTAIIAPWKSEAKRIWKLLESSLGEGAAPQLIDAEDSLPATGVIITTLKLAKGLEFDHVIVPDASQKVFPDDMLSRRRLYTTISRATKTITLLSLGKLTELLK